jgi:hypothetical protein
VRTVRRECLNFHIPLSEAHLKRTLIEWIAHYNHGRPHRGLGPGIPTTSPRLHRFLPTDMKHLLIAELVAKSILGGLHHEYALSKVAA